MRLCIWLWLCCAAFYFSVGHSVLALAGTPPPCLADGQPIPANNQQISDWKRSTDNEFLARGHATGKVGAIYPNKTGHKHFQIILDGTEDTLEIVYNLSFGKLPTLKAGMKVEACGDYITAYEQSGDYPPSPDGAILHWVHSGNHDLTMEYASDDFNASVFSRPHDPGYLDIDGVVYGQ